MAQFPPGSVLYAQSIGSRPENVEVPVIQTRAPASTDKNYPVGKMWVDSSDNSVYVLSSFSSSSGVTSATWASLGSEAGVLESLTADDAVIALPTAGTIILSGTTNQIDTAGTASPGEVGFSLSSTLIAPGSLEVTGLLTGDAGATIDSAGTAINIGTDVSGDAVNVGTSGARAVTIGSTLTTAATVIQAGSGDLNITADNTIQSVGNAAGDVTNQLTNSDNTDPASNASYQVAVGGTAAGDPYIDFLVSGAGHFAMGIDNSDSDNFVLAASGALGTSNALTVSSAGDVVATGAVTATLGALTATDGNLVFGSAGNKIVSTDFASTIAAGASSFGSITLIGGTITISTTAMSAGSGVILSRQSVGSTGANDLGILSVGAIVADTSFVINSWTVTDATALQTDDVSVVAWMIFN